MSTIDLYIDLRTARNKIRETSKGKPRNLTPEELDILLTGQARILNLLTQTWPVRTGDSKNAWRVKLKTKPTLGYQVSNAMDYASYVFRAGEKAGGPLYNILIAQVFTDIITDINTQIAQVVDIQLARMEQDEQYTGELEELERINRVESARVLRKASARARPLIRARRRPGRRFAQ
tara:strand:+ start:7888 stop:8418 length:531 start_codon:yes stop_codon:yes gene_type:complete